MLSNFYVALGAVLPIFVLVGIGVFVRWRKLLTDTELEHVNRMVFRVFFFCMMFYNLYVANYSTAFHPDLAAFGFFGVLFLFFASLGTVCLYEKSNYRRGAMVQAIFRSNYVLLGVPIIVNIFGRDAITVPSTLIAVVVPLYNLLAVIELEAFRGDEFAPVSLIRGLLKNPMICGALTALVARCIGLELPKALLNPIGEVAAATTPVALIILGASFRLDSLRGEIRGVIFCTLARLIVVPAIMLGLAVYLGFRGEEFVTLLTIFATPCAVAGFAMAQQMGSDAELAGSCVLLSSGLSCFTIFGWVFLSKSLGLF